MKAREFLIAGLLFGAPVSADMISDEGMAPYEVCALCHSLDGISAMAKFPILAGQKPDYIEKQINDFRSGQRSNDGGQMRDIVTELAPEDILIVANWFASQTQPTPANMDPNPQGAELYSQHGCADCHEGEGPKDLTPPHVAAQHEAYLVKQLKDFRSGFRENDPGGVMREKAGQLSDADIAALAAYIATLPRP